MSVWHEIVVEGSEDALRGFVAGIEAIAGMHEPVVFGVDLEIEPASFVERVRELFAAGSHQILFAPEREVADIVRALRAAGAGVGLTVTGLRRVENASFRFSVEAYSRQVVEEIRAALLASLPPGVKIEDLRQREVEDGKSRGTELYSPAHDYTYRATGLITGPFTGVLEMHRRARPLDFVSPEPIAIEAVDLPLP